MAKRKRATSTKTKAGKSELSSSILNVLNKGAGTSALIPDNFDEQIANNPEQLVKELSSNFAMIPINQIEANPDQPRREFKQEPLRELADSIKVHGIIQPLTVRRLADKQYQIISGERRWQAAKLAQLAEVPGFIRIANDQTLMEMALIENIQREDLNPVEIAVTYQRLMDEFQIQDDLADRVGKDRTTVSNYIRLLKCHPDVIDALRNSKISFGHGRAIAGVSDTLLQKEFLKQILDQKLSVRKAETLAKSYKEKKAKPTKRTRERGRFELEREQILQDFKVFFGHKKIKIQMEEKGSDKGQIIIQFESNDQLHNLFKCVEQL